MILSDSYITFNRKMSKFRGHYVSLESKVRGHLKQKRAKSPFFEGQGKPWINISKLTVIKGCQWSADQIKSHFYLRPIQARFIGCNYGP